MRLSDGSPFLLVEIKLFTKGTIIFVNPFPVKPKENNKKFEIKTYFILFYSWKMKVVYSKVYIFSTNTS